jgi:hypothetical protein
MRRLAAAVILATLITAACGPAERPRPEAEPASSPEAKAARRTIDRFWAFEQVRLNAAFERRRARDLPFMFATTGVDRYLGVECSNPRGTRALPLAGDEAFWPDDTIEPPAAQRRSDLREAARRQAALAGNLRALARDDFPYPDLCRASGGSAGPMTADALSGRSALAAYTGPARDLHDAARRGDAAEVRRWLARAGSIDTPDSFGLTPMAWAVLRRRPETVDILLDAGGSPVAGAGRPGEHSAAWFAARSGDAEMFERFERYSGRTSRAGVPAWPESVIEAALLSGSRETVERITYGLRHAPVDPDQLRLWASRSPEAARLLKDSGLRRRLGGPLAVTPAGQTPGPR